MQMPIPLKIFFSCYSKFTSFIFDIFGFYLPFAFLWVLFFQGSGSLSFASELSQDSSLSQKIGHSKSIVSCGRTAGSIPFARFRPGRPNPEMPVDHIIVIMQENHSFDNYLGNLNDPKYYGAEIDGIPKLWSNPDKRGQAVYFRASDTLCPRDPGHQWNEMHNKWNFGKNDGFVIHDQTPSVMTYHDDKDLPFYYALASTFATGDRYFCSLLGPTLPNRFYLMTGTSFGHIRNDIPKRAGEFSQKTIFELLNDYGITWKYYTNGVGYLEIFSGMYARNLKNIKRLRSFHSDLRNGKLPQIVFVESTSTENDEHPAQNIQLGQAFVAEQVNAVLKSPLWPRTVMFVTYDENGGFADHVSPPSACRPDNIEPMLKNNDIRANFDRYGFRVPVFVVSPFAKRHHVSHVVYDHTSILKFIETRYNLPALTNRDANADDMSDFFDFQNPDFSVPKLPSGLPDGREDKTCKLNNLAAKKTKRGPKL